MKVDFDVRRLSAVPFDRSVKSLPRDQLVRNLALAAADSNVTAAVEMLASFAGAAHYLLAREDLLQEAGLNFIITSDWPFDLVRRLSLELTNNQNRVSEMEKCLALLKPRMLFLPEDAVIPHGVNPQYCAITFCVGRVRFSLLLLFAEDSVPVDDRLREAGMLAGYFASSGVVAESRVERDIDLTERELECLFWIAEGKTSDEMATILGISRNTINNYITSVMRKTATKTRSEAIAYAVRNNLV
ncbi:LuxR family transcriptional regulator [Agrobacterium tumefaciens]|uniref:LuxR family transcriptional regulator n=1 Tax=Agrobacterium tumefaciens TaxID=358 RepID=A0A0D0KRD1_AGRTU|nr:MULTISPECIES: helix-turn-helix domain-containing protein [Rhizobium]KIQ02304.1 LuxR family transcriptional regulator [Agrobacterium tumefaciens]MBD8685933.1 helix-turn-helix domain-containing protein [Rhizobium sp. CFBP 13644]MBD8690394.1 helix-turn-helix domain-containing protein [Rhizobium sp. CFBP 13717]MCI9866472.1 helix-turn-helix domain-containing protein [Rhizobium skierniewicense]